MKNKKDKLIISTIIVLIIAVLSLSCIIPIFFVLIGMNTFALMICYFAVREIDNNKVVLKNSIKAID